MATPLYLAHVTRTAASAADLALCAHANNTRRSDGHPITPTRLERWRQQGLLPGNRPAHLGGRRGSTSTPPAEAFELVTWLADHARRGRRPHDLAVLAFKDGMPVPERTVREAFTAAIARLPFPSATSLDGDLPLDRDEQASAVAERVLLSEPTALQPRRVRRVDTRLTHALRPQRDRPDSTEPYTLPDAVYTLTTAVAQGPSTVSLDEVADLLRLSMPPGQTNAVADHLEQASLDPVGHGLNTFGGFDVLGTDDMITTMRKVLDASTLDDVHLALDTQDSWHAWAWQRLQGVEAELEAGQFGTEALAWLTDLAYGLPRVLILQQLRVPTPSPMERAWQAALLLQMRSILSFVDVLSLPDEQRDALRLVVPEVVLPVLLPGL